MFYSPLMWTECDKSILFGERSDSASENIDFHSFFRNLQLENRPVRVTHRRSFLFKRSPPDSVHVLSARVARERERERGGEGSLSVRAQCDISPAALFTFIAVFVFLSINIRVPRISASVFLFSPSPFSLPFFFFFFYHIPPAVTAYIN